MVFKLKESSIDIQLSYLEAISRISSPICYDEKLVLSKYFLLECSLNLIFVKIWGARYLVILCTKYNYSSTSSEVIKVRHYNSQLLMSLYTQIMTRNGSFKRKYQKLWAIHGHFVRKIMLKKQAIYHFEEQSLV